MGKNRSIEDQSVVGLSLIPEDGERDVAERGSFCASRVCLKYRLYQKKETGVFT